MAFLFKSKKNADKTQSARDLSNGTIGSQSSMQTGLDGRMVQSENRGTPGSSVNNSLNSLPGGASPSPDQLGGRRGPSADLAQDSPVSASSFLRRARGAQRALGFAITDLLNPVAEWTSPVNGASPQCFIIPLVEAPDNIHDGPSQPVPPIWRSRKFRRFKGGRCVPYGWPHK